MAYSSILACVLLFTATLPCHPVLARPNQQYNFDFPYIRPDATRPFTITVEGNVGAGKSTLLNYFKLFSEIAVYVEPVTQWQNMNGTNFLDLALKDPVRWGMTFESLVALTMTEIHMKDEMDSQGVLKHPVKVMERSLHSAHYCFMEYMVPLITEGEIQILNEWYDLLNSRTEFNTDVDLIVYLRTSPEVAMERVKRRGRTEETEYRLENFQTLHTLHENWLIGENRTASQPVIIIEADEDITTLHKTYRHLAKAVFKSTTKF